MSIPRKSFFYVLLLITGLCNNFLYSQPQLNNPQIKNLIFVERNILPRGDSLECIVSYRIPYSELVFVKNGSFFECNVNFECEVKQNSKIVNRKSSSSIVITENYEKSRDSEKYLEGFVSFQLNQDNHYLFPNLQISNIERRIELDSISIFPKRLVKDNFIQPISVLKGESNCNDLTLYKLNNWGNSIPFSTDETILIVPILRRKSGKVKYFIQQNNSQVFTGEISECVKQPIKFDLCNNALFLINGKLDTQTEFFIIKDFSHLLSEGNAKLVIESEDGNKSEFNLNVTWHNKPKSLSNPEFAIELIKYISDELTLKMIFSKSSDEYYSELLKFWDSRIPNRNYKFNNLMEEYYKRADYANANFNTITKQNGALSDRGKIYILYGKPDQTKREYSLKNFVAEIWFYNNIKKEFVFLDETGLGNFILSK